MTHLKDNMRGMTGILGRSSGLSGPPMMEEGINDELLHVATLCSRESPNLQDCIVSSGSKESSWAAWHVTQLIQLVPGVRWEIVPLR